MKFNFNEQVRVMDKHPWVGKVCGAPGASGLHPDCTERGNVNLVEPEKMRKLTKLEKALR